MIERMTNGVFQKNKCVYIYIYIYIIIFFVFSSRCSIQVKATLHQVPTTIMSDGKCLPHPQALVLWMLLVNSILFNNKYLVPLHLSLSSSHRLRSRQSQYNTTLPFELGAAIFVCVLG